MNYLKKLREKIKNKEAKIAVIGLGYVGLPVACMFAESGFSIIGLDIKQKRIELIKAGTNPIEGDEPGLSELLRKVVDLNQLETTTNYEKLKAADVVLIDVETPVDENHKPRYHALKSACTSLARIMKKGVLIIVESTIAPGTINRVVKPILEENSGLVLNHDFYLGTCPERVMPGKLLENLRKMSRVCGGINPECANIMVDLYRNIVDADLDPCDIVTAELVKTVENSYRDVQIAFANEVALICENNAADVWKVRELVNKSPGRNMLYPGAGVGGHCIPKDPWLLMSSYNDPEFQLELLPAARAVNEYMPLHVLKLLKEAFKKKGISLSNSQILILGYAYLENSDDTRNSPSERLVARLKTENAKVKIHDPWVSDYQGHLLELAKDCDAAVIMAAHKEYRDLSTADLVNSLRHPIVIDGRNIIDPEEMKEKSLIFKSLGRG